MKIVILNECFLGDEQLKELSENNDIERYEVTSSVEEVTERIKNAEVIFVDQFICPLSTEILDSAKYLKLIVLNTTSYHLLDLDYLKSRNIALCNTPDFCSDSVAELTFVYILSLMKKIITAYEDNKKAPFEIFPDELSHRKYVGRNLSEKTIGVIGLGNIGQKICRIAQGFNMKVLGYNRSVKDITGVMNVELEKLLQESDIVVVTVPYNDATHGLIGKENILKLKQGVVIVNISSQDILDEETVIESLKNGKIGGYGLDNFINKDKEHYFYNSSKVMVLPHLGFFTQESLDMIGVRMMEGYKGFIENENINRII